MSARILIVDDELDLRTTLVYNFEREGYQVATAADGESALEAARSSSPPDLVILDLMLPDMPGTEICRRLRSEEGTRETPILMLTAKGEEVDRVVGFEVGADDYVVKPFSVRELLLRTRALLRRSERSASDEENVVRFGVLRLDRGSHRAWVEEGEIALTALEFRLLDTFLRRKGRVQTRDVLLSEVWGIDAEVTTRTVDTHVKRLREKLGSAGAYVETLRGVGYRFRDEPDEGEG